MSRGNDKYSGAQIRLLQAACEEVSKHDIKTMPLNSMFASARFHTMMGFRPNEVEGREVTSIESAYDMMESVKEKTSVDGSYFIPILTKRDDKFFFDSNRTLYYAAMRYNEDTLAKENVRHLDMFDGDCSTEIKMSLKGNELAEWFKRIIGFRIMP